MVFRIKTIYKQTKSTTINMKLRFRAFRWYIKRCNYRLGRYSIFSSRFSDSFLQKKIIHNKTTKTGHDLIKTTMNRTKQRIDILKWIIYDFNYLYNEPILFPLAGVFLLLYFSSFSFFVVFVVVWPSNNCVQC